MIEKWMADVVGRMHLHGITAKKLAEELNWNSKYLSQVLNGRVNPKGAEEKVKSALEMLISRTAA